jgi:hypothetical protein
MIQVTTTSGISARRRKLEQIPWPITTGVFRVSIFECRTDIVAIGRKRREYWFRIHDLSATGVWSVDWRLEITPEAMKPPKKLVDTPHGSAVASPASSARAKKTRGLV